MGSTARAGWCWRRGRGWRNPLCEMDIQAIIDAIRHNRVRITDHADEEAQSVWAYNHVTQWAVLVTVYRPDPKRWVDWRIRRKA